METVAVPGGADVLAFLGWQSDADLEASADTHARHATALVRAYTRGRGFPTPTTCAPDVAEVVRSAAARSLSNPTHDRRIEAGSYNRAPGSLESLSLLETLVLRGYRRTAG